MTTVNASTNDERSPLVRARGMVVVQSSRSVEGNPAGSQLQEGVNDLEPVDWKPIQYSTEDLGFLQSHHVREIQINHVVRMFGLSPIRLARRELSLPIALETLSFHFR